MQEEKVRDAAPPGIMRGLVLVTCVFLLCYAARGLMPDEAHDDGRQDKEESIQKESSTAIIMYDTRRPKSIRDHGFSQEYWSMAAELNRRFACSRNYDFIYYLEGSKEMKSSELYRSQSSSLNEGNNGVSKVRETCYLNNTVGRSTPWCKLCAVAAALSKGYERVAFLDSDAFFKPSGLEAIPDIDSLFAKYAPRKHTQNTPDVWFASNAPYGALRANTGLQIWENRATSWHFLRRWWRTNHKPTLHAFEQHGLVELFRSSPRYDPIRESFQVLSYMPWMVDQNWSHLPAVHIASFSRHLRTQVMTRQIADDDRNFADNEAQQVSNVQQQRTCRQRPIPVQSISTSAIARAYLDNDAPFA